MSAVRLAFASGKATAVNAVYHVVVVDGPVFVSACNRWTVLDHDTEVGLSATSAGMRCYRPACRSRWAGGASPEGAQG